MQLRFEWHEEKAENNLKKHGISFEQAKTVFNGAHLGVGGGVPFGTVSGGASGEGLG